MFRVAKRGQNHSVGAFRVVFFCFVKAFHTRLRQDCDHQLRIIETSDWSKRPDNERNDDPDYAIYERVRRDLKRQSKGENWYQSGLR